MSPTLLVVAAWIAGSPWGPVSIELEREVAPLPLALESLAPRLSHDEVFAGERVRVEWRTGLDRPLELECAALGWEAVAARLDAGSDAARWQLTVPADALPGVYVLELRDALGDGAQVLALLDLVVLADD